ncbi:MAG: hypothetical protein WKF36_01305 [Candidatus Nitrosocosmicus sp.]
MLKEQVFYIALVTVTLFSPIHLNAAGINNTFFPKAYGHSFTPNDYASFMATMDQFLTEFKLVQANMANNNITLAQGHANKAASIYVWNLMGEIAGKDQKTAEEITKTVKTLQNITSPSTAAAGEQQQQVNQMVANVDTKVNEIMAMTIREQKADPGFSDPFAWLMSSIFGEKKDNDNTTKQPLRVAELVDSVLRSYGNAYNVGFDMTDISNMAMQSDKSSMPMSNMMTDDDNITVGMDPMNTSSYTMMNGKNKTSNNYSLANVADYQSAQGLAAKALEIFNNELKPMTSNNDSAGSVSNLENGLLQLNDSVRGKASPMDVMVIAHTQVHPNLLEAFSIPLKPGA